MTEKDKEIVVKYDFAGDHYEIFINSKRFSDKGTQMSRVRGYIPINPLARRKLGLATREALTQQAFTVLDNQGLLYEERGEERELYVTFAKSLVK